MATRLDLIANVATLKAITGDLAVLLRGDASLNEIGEAVGPLTAAAKAVQDTALAVMLSELKR